MMYTHNKKLLIAFSNGAEEGENQSGTIYIKKDMLIGRDETIIAIRGKHAFVLNQLWYERYNTLNIKSLRNILF